MTDTSLNVLAVEVGEIGAWIATGLGAIPGKNQRRLTFSSPPSAAEAFDAIVGSIDGMSSAQALSAVGIVSWDSLGSERGKLASEIATLLNARFQVPTSIEHAIVAAARAEILHDAAQNRYPSAYVHLGRDVRAAIVTQGGEVVSSSVGQIGHWRVSESGPRCSCGQVGHLNPICSSQGFVRLAIGAISQDEAALDAAGSATGGRIEAITAPRVVRLAGEGVQPLQELVEISANALGIALANLALLANPAYIVLGGPLGVSGGSFLEQVQTSVRELLHGTGLDWDGTEIIPARFEPNSALIGVQLLAIDAIFESEKHHIAEEGV